MFMRLRSINALKLSIKNNKKAWCKLLDKNEIPSPSTISRGLEKSDIAGLRKISALINHRLRRNKAFNTDAASYGLMVAAIDGHETAASEKRCCSACKVRKKSKKGKKIKEYYHSYVVCQLILSDIPVFVDMEPIRPHEGETTAAKRLIKRILNEQKRLIDVFSFDALYLDSSIMNLLDKSNKFWVAVLKQENRQAYAEIDRLLPETKPQKIKLDKKDVRLWEMSDLVGWDNLDKPFRAVVSEETSLVLETNKHGIKEPVEKITHWRWLTNLPNIYSAKVVFQFGHGRWNIENRGFNDLVNQCHFDHPFHHHPTALLAMLWIISLAFILSYAFFQRNIKSQLKKIIETRSQLAELIKSSLVLVTSPIYIPLSP